MNKKIKEYFDCLYGVSFYRRQAYTNYCRESYNGAMYFHLLYLVYLDWTREAFNKMSQDEAAESKNFEYLLLGVNL